MAAPISGAPTLTTTDSADEPGMKRTRLNEAFDALSQVRLRARSLRCSPGWPILTLILIYAALAVCLALALACPPAHGDASAPKAPSGAGAPLPNTSASADHYRFPLTREPNFMSATTRTVLWLWHRAGASTSHPTNLPPSFTSYLRWWLLPQLPATLLPRKEAWRSRREPTAPPSPSHSTGPACSAHIPGGRFALCHPALPSVYVW